MLSLVVNALAPNDGVLWGQNVEIQKIVQEHAMGLSCDEDDSYRFTGSASWGSP